MLLVSERTLKTYMMFLILGINTNNIHVSLPDKDLTSEATCCQQMIADFSLSGIFVSIDTVSFHVESTVHILFHFC